MAKRTPQVNSAQTKKGAHTMLSSDNLRVSAKAVELLKDIANREGNDKALKVACIAKKAAFLNNRKTVLDRDISISRC